MAGSSQQKIKRATVIYWLLLFYIMAALVWWFVSLETQNREIRQLKEQVSGLQEQIPHTGPVTSIAEIRKASGRNDAKYIGEGVAFLILILVGAAFVYRSVRRQFHMQEQQQNFMMAVTHELKTPISVARLNLETLQKYSLEPEKQKKLIRNALDETARLNFLTNNILIASQLEGGRYESAREEMDLSDLLKDRMQDFRNRFPDREFRDLVEPDADLRGDPMLLQILINNLVENAIKYSPRESPVTAILDKQGSMIRLQIIDEGPGIPDTEKKKIFTRFYRIGNEATRTKQGTGLGLYLCSIIARGHNADISVTNNEPAGSNFTVVFK